MPTNDLLKVGISQCLMGSQVRYDGGHKANVYVLDLLVPHFDLVPICPEVEAGMGVPRETVQLQLSGEDLRMVGTATATDHTDVMEAFVIRKVEDLAGVELCGYIFKSGSPSCGLAVEAVGLEQPVKGLFAEAFTKAFPHIPVVEETELADPVRRQGWVEQVFAYSRQMRFMSKERSVGQLVMAHAQARLQLDAHEDGAHADVAQLFKKASQMSYEELCEVYLGRFMEVLNRPMSVTRHFETLKKVFDAVKGGLEPGAVKELARGLQDYRQGNLPLAVPLMMLRHYVRVQDNLMLNGQTYLEPEPREFLLRTQL